MGSANCNHFHVSALVCAKVVFYIADSNLHIIIMLTAFYIQSLESSKHRCRFGFGDL